MTDIELALVMYDGSDLPYADLVYRALKELQAREKHLEAKKEPPEGGESITR
jgi:hypothetical protein